MTLAKLLKEKNMTQGEFAGKLNVSQSTISKWCRCLSCPKVAILYRMTKLLNVTFDDLILCFEKILIHSM